MHHRTSDNWVDVRHLGRPWHPAIWKTGNLNPSERGGEVSYTVEKDGKVIQKDSYGNKLYGKPQFKVEGTKVYQTDVYGRSQQKLKIEAQQKK